MGGDRPLRLGWLADQRLGWSALLETAQAVERLGYDSLWMSDHFLDEQGRWFADGWTTLAAVLACVPRVEAGFLVASANLRVPMVTAQMTSTLADIGAGRFVLGLGAGGSRHEHLAAGVGFLPLDDRMAVVETTCRLVRSGVPGTVGGPRPSGLLGPGRDDARVPLLLGGGGDPMLRLAGSYADRWAIWGLPGDLAARGEILSRHAAEAGRDPGDIRRAAIVMLLPEHLRERADPSPWPAELRGGPSAVAEQLARYQQAGVEDIIVCDHGLEPAGRLAALEWFAAVMAPFHRIAVVTTALSED